MKKTNFLTIVMMLFVVFAANCQQNWRYFSQENVSLKLPEDWTTTNAAKPRGPMTITAKSSDGNQFVEIKCEPMALNIKNRANDIATSRSQHANFEYMQIDKVNKTKFKNNDAQLLNYTNTYLNDTYKGGVYSFVNEGYTYTIEYYGEDNKQTQKLLQDIVNTITVSSADKKDNISDREQKYNDKDWSEQKVDEAALKAEKEAQKAKEKADRDVQKAKEKEQKAKEKAEKEIEKQQQKIEKQQKELEKKQKELEKKQQKAEKEKQKAAKKLEKAEKKRLEKEQKIDKLKGRQKNIEKELNSLASEQIKLSEQYGQAQLKNDAKKMEKIQKKQIKAAEKVTKLNKEKDDIVKKLKKL